MQAMVRFQGDSKAVVANVHGRWTGEHGDGKDPMIIDGTVLHNSPVMIYRYWGKHKGRRKLGTINEW